MQITRHTDYALRVLMYLAVSPDRVTLGEIAERLGVSRHHLMKVGASLGELGLVDLVRGPGGGISLAVDPDEISVGAVFRSLENCVLVECFDAEEDHCVFSGSCALTGVLNTAFEAFCRELDAKSLGDLVRQRARLRASLGLGKQRKAP